jgi:PIN domain nuclease of toxin-antitoxin system
VAIKRTLAREDFQIEPRLLRRGLLDNGYSEIPITSAHAIALDSLPALHKDPFDRMLIAQAQVEGIVLVTSDARVAQYPGAIQKV